jgi:hypothetical protein
MSSTQPVPIRHCGSGLATDGGLHESNHQLGLAEPGGSRLCDAACPAARASTGGHDHTTGSAGSACAGSHEPFRAGRQRGHRAAQQGAGRRGRRAPALVTGHSGIRTAVGRAPRRLRLSDEPSQPEQVWREPLPGDVWRLHGRRCRQGMGEREEGLWRRRAQRGQLGARRPLHADGVATDPATRMRPGDLQGHPDRRLQPGTHAHRLAVPRTLPYWLHP